MERVMKTIGKLLEILIRLGYAAGGIVVIAGLAYLFGHHLLIGQMKGADATFAYHNASWYARWWPRIPIWYPVQGGGFSLTLSYAVASSFLAVWFSQVTNLNLNQAMRLLLWAAYLWGGLGIYVYGAWRLKNQTVGLMAAVFYLILPNIWYWSMDIGLFAFSVTISLIPWVFCLFDWWVESGFVGGRRKQIGALLAAALSFGLVMMFHVMIGASLLAALPVYGAIRGWALGKKGWALKPAIKGLGMTILAMVIGMGLVAFWSLPYAQYNMIADREKLTAESVEFLTELNTKSLLEFPTVVIVFSLVGLGLAAGLRQGAVAGAVVGMGLIYWNWVPKILPRGLVETLRLPLSVTQRVICISDVLIPITAAFGIGMLAKLIVELPFWPMKLIKGNTGERLVNVSRPLKAGLTMILSLGIMAGGLMIFEGQSENNIYGPTDVFVAKEKEKEGFEGSYFKPEEDGQQLKVTGENLEKTYAWKWLAGKAGEPVVIESNPTSGEEAAKKILGSLPPLDQYTRVGWSGFEGVGLQAFGNYTPASTMAQYMYKGSLMHAMRGMTEKAFFDKQNPLQTPATITNLAEWVGYEYVLAKPPRDNVSHYLPPEWEIYEDQGGWRVYKFAHPQTLVTVSRRPTVLVIGKFLNAYDAVFRGAAAGVLPYDNVWLVEGKEKVDDYSVEELRQFEGVILHGYNYGKQSRAFSILEEYVKGGGKVFIDTGWQYTAKDWQLAEAPEWLPVVGTEWSTEIPPGEHQVVDEGQRQALGVNEVPFSWEKQARGFSKATGLKPGAKAVLTIEGQPLIVKGSYGQGEVIWSGMNLFAYLSAYDYDEQLVEMAARIFKLQYPDYPKENLKLISVARDYPDRVEILVPPLPQGGRLLWREADSPQWKITDEENRRLTHWRAGPGFVLVDIPPTNQPINVKLEYQLGWTGWAGKVISGVILIVLIAGLLAPKLLGKLWTGKTAGVNNGF
jgi:hypothetical protein